jgi:hypothetical protein
VSLGPHFTYSTPQTHMNLFCHLLESDVGRVSENPDVIPEHKRGEYVNVQVRNTVDERGDKESPKDCSCIKSCESLYTCPRAPFYRETKGILHSKNTLDSNEYSQCEHAHQCPLHPVICRANLIYLQACH